MTHKVTTDIINREKIFINPNDGTRRTKLKGGEEIPNSSPYQTGRTSNNKAGQGTGSSEQPKDQGGNSEEKAEGTQPKTVQIARCPVCEGTGKVDKILPKNTVAVNFATCHGCEGKGWVKL